MQANAKIYVAGHCGLAGSALVRRLRAEGFQRIVVRSHAELDLTQAPAVDAFFAQERPDYVFLAAARVGGIHANRSYPVDFLRDNILIQTHVIDAAYRYGATKLLLLGSSCIYPKHAPQPMREDALLSGPLEPTNEWYAIAKIAGLKLCQAYRRQYGFNAITVMPTNLYGPGDNFNLQTSHVLPALLRKFHIAKIQGSSAVTVWGSGEPRREFLYVDDFADAALYLMRRYDDEGFINVGIGQDIRIADLAQQIAVVVGFHGAIHYDRSMPDGTPRKLLDISRLEKLGWRARMTLAEGLQATYDWFRAHLHELRD
ncbi:MAG: GDP-L-fucose synthase [Gammaproteobacteria bacterium]